jgi:hypothetical protein
MTASPQSFVIVLLASIKTKVVEMKVNREQVHV